MKSEAGNLGIKVVGVGGSGNNAVSRMKKCDIKGVEMIVINADVQDLRKSGADRKLQIGEKITQGLGTGMDPEIGRQAAEENREEIKEVLKGADVVFITCGLGGGCGTGASPVVAEIAKEIGALTIAVVTNPFSFEGLYRQNIAKEGLAQLKKKVDTLITIDNDKLLKILDPKTALISAFWSCDDILREAVKGISDLIMLPGIINVDFADIKAIMKDSGTAIFGVGITKGEKRAIEAAKKAIESPLLNISPRGAKGILFNVSGGDVSLSEINEVGELIAQEVNPSAKIIFGAVQDSNLKKGEIKVTIIATGF